jgi:hypothetical protein
MSFGKILVLKEVYQLRRKSQAALEFLTTYAWAFLVILLTLGALYYFGIFDFGKFLPQKCLFPSQFECLAFSFAAADELLTNEVRFRLVNNIGEKINVNSFEITDDAQDPLTCTGFEPSPLPSDWKSGVEIDFAFTDCTDGGYLVNERMEAKIIMKYCAVATPGCPEHTINGKITAVVS